MSANLYVGKAGIAKELDRSYAHGGRSVFGWRAATERFRQRAERQASVGAARVTL